MSIEEGNRKNANATLNLRSYKTAQGKKGNNQCDNESGGNITDTTERKEIEVTWACGAKR